MICGIVYDQIWSDGKLRRSRLLMEEHRPSVLVRDPVWCERRLSKFLEFRQILAGTWAVAIVTNHVVRLIFSRSHNLAKVLNAGTTDGLIQVEISRSQYERLFHE